HRVRRQILVAIFAVRPELQRHDGLFALVQGIIANPPSKTNAVFPSIRAIYFCHAGARGARTRNPYARSWLWIPGLRQSGASRNDERVDPTAPAPSAAALRFPSAGPARSTSAHAPRSGAA